MKRKTIGIFIDWSSTQYHQDLLFGITNTAKKLDMNIICFEGAELNAKLIFDKARNKIYDFAKSKNIDGLIICTANVGKLLTQEEINLFIEKFKSIPIVSLGKIENIPSIIINNKTGVKELLNHLIIKHKYHRFAFIKGPETSDDSKERYNIFLEILKDANIPIDNDLIFSGDFTVQSGFRVAKEIFELKSKLIDVIVSCNDEMALEVLQYFSNNGLIIPDNIALTGFDDIERSKHAYPALTSVRLPIYEMGQKAAEYINELISGNNIPLITSLETNLIIRESCGCGIAEKSNVFLISHQLNEKNNDNNTNKKVNIIARLNNYVEHFHLNIIGISIDIFINELVLSYFDAVSNFANESFLYKLNNYLQKIKQEEYYLEIMEKFLRFFFHSVIDYFTEKNEISFTYELSLLSFKLVNEKLKQLAGKRFIQLAEFKEIILSLSRSLMIKFDRKEFYINLSNVLPEFNIKNCYIIFFNSEDISESKLDFIYKNNRMISNNFKDIIFDTYKLIPDEYLNKSNKFNLVVEALIHEDECKGFIIFEDDELSWGFYDQVYMILNNALQGTILFGRLQTQKDVLLIQKENLDKNLSDLRQAMSGFIETMSLTIETRDPYTAGHQKRVSDLARTIAREMNLPKDVIEGIRMAATIHDLGKINIPAEILNRPGKLSKIEFEMIKSHPLVAYEILKNIKFPWPIAEIIYQHHEKLNGSGYPRGLKENEILLEAKIIHVADVVEAISSHRPYRAALGLNKALEEISMNKGILYDPLTVEICINLFLKKGYQFS